MDMSSPFYLSYAALWVVVIVQSVILLGLMPLVYQLRHGGANDEPWIGRQAPEFSTVDLRGTPISSADFGNHLTALLFVSPSCPSCTTTLVELEALQYKTGGHVVIVCRGDEADCARLAEDHGPNLPTVVDQDEHISRLFGVTSAPTAVLINERQRIQSYGHPQRGDLERAFEQAETAEVRG